MNDMNDTDRTERADPRLAEYDAAIDAGRIAYLAGQPVTDCPYFEDGPAREGWLDGYHG